MDPNSISHVLETHVTPQQRQAFDLILQHANWNPATDRCEQVADALQDAIYQRDEPAIHTILDTSADLIIEACHNTQPRLHTPLLSAAECGLVDAARRLWHLLGPDGRSNPRNTTTCLAVAAEHGHPHVVAEFLDLWDGWPPSETSQALLGAGREWHEDVITLLLSGVSYDTTTLQNALDESVDDRVVWMAGRNHRDTRDTDRQSRKQYHTVCQLLDAGADPNGTRLHDPILRRAVSKIHPPMRLHPCPNRIGAVRALLEKGADPNGQDFNGNTALHSLLRRPSSSIRALTLLLDHGASPETLNQDDETPLHAVAYAGTLERLHLCLAQCHDEDAAIHLRTRAPMGESPLHYAAAGGREDIVEFLLSRGVNVNATNGNGWTPLLCALMPTEHKSSSDACRIARLLLQHGADARVVSEEGWTPLHALASHVLHPASRQVSRRGEDVVPLARELVARGASLDAETVVIASASMAREDLCGTWGYRMGKFCHELRAQEVTEAVPPTMVGAEPHTTPLMWACRVGAMGIFEVILERLAVGRATPALGSETRER